MTNPQETQNYKRVFIDYYEEGDKDKFTSTHGITFCGHTYLVEINRTSLTYYTVKLNHIPKEWIIDSNEDSAIPPQTLDIEQLINELLKRGGNGIDLTLKLKILENAS